MSPFRSIARKKEPVKRRKLRVRRHVWRFLLVLLFVPVRFKTGTITVRPPLFCLIELQTRLVGDHG